MQDRQRLNVALTRAKLATGGWQHGHLAGDSSPVFIFYFNFDFQHASQMWKELVNNAKERKVFLKMMEEEHRLKEALSVDRKV